MTRLEVISLIVGTEVTDSQDGVRGRKSNRTFGEARNPIIERSDGLLTIVLTDKDAATISILK